MTSAAWIALGSLTFTLAVFLGGIIFNMGKMSQRINNLEGGKDSNETFKEKTIRLEERVANVQDDIASMKRTLEGIQRSLANIAHKNMGFAAE